MYAYSITCQTLYIPAKPKCRKKRRDGPSWFEKTGWKTKIAIKPNKCEKMFCQTAAPTASFSVKSGYRGFRELVLWK